MEQNLNLKIPRCLAIFIHKLDVKKIIKRKIYDLFCDVESYDGSGQIVHPDIEVFQGKIYMVCTPYPFTTAMYENPCLYIKDERCMRFYEDKHIKNPLAEKRGKSYLEYMSDPTLINFCDKLYIYYREGQFIEKKLTEFLHLKIYDGQMISEEITVLCSSKDIFLSPVILRHKDNLFMYCVKYYHNNQSSLCIRKSTDGINWSEPTSVMVNNIPDNMFVWHICIATSDKKRSKHVTDLSEKLTGLFLLKEKTEKRYHLYFACSNGIFNEWRIMQEIVIDEAINVNNSQPYKSTFVTGAGKILLSTFDNKGYWRLFYINDTVNGD